MISLRKIPATIVTGFLGAGKTTLLRHLVEGVTDRRIALIVNEFGEVGVDGEVLSACGVPGCTEVVELANGCLCCTVADEFLPAVTALLERENPPDHILIETSGLALPKPLVKAFQWPDVRSKITVDGVVAVVDAKALAGGRFADDEQAMEAPDHDNPLEEVFTDQLACADLVLLNKIDLVDGTTLAALNADLAGRLRAGVKLVGATHGRVDPLVLLGLSAAAEDDLAARPSHHDLEGEHDHDDFESFCLDLPEVADADALQSRLAAAIADHDILRLKGFLAIPDKAARQVVQAVGTRIERYFDRPWRTDEPRRSRLVVIGLKGLDRAAIAAAIGAAPA